ncbi:hypothetical protein NSS60_04500 [Anoxybacillus sp. FSL W8-0382]|uniref:Uncharacterized protein n=1 Tax=Anoxybacillus flavithermus TaxID=33934 RepID=A0A178TNF7_9BACL|nr:hypothetical protein [Anoxybacillus flavithermus]MBE2906246.1 hypothetical protein [Anoxybacillus flavithermus]MBE2909979.1 hypothetical protein [Anoxybacillus flavithermus]MBE2925232.1 hypothetical protein [Anoxybacillus flavithermus]MBE2926168.1 hypothetical protein [Anoxybacillus flavithermus]MBE2928355.1 hypothetical protein [Anoxybacillus flavithermus]
MLAEAVVRVGESLVSSDLPLTERIRLLTDVDNEACKNFFEHVWVVECIEEQVNVRLMRIGEKVKEGKKETFVVDRAKNVAFPIIYPNGGNPLNAQGSYALPCYLMYDRHIKMLKNSGEFAKEMLFPRFERTLCMRHMDNEQKFSYAKKIADLLSRQVATFVYEEKQLGILMIVNPLFPAYQYASQQLDPQRYIKIGDSRIETDKSVYLDGKMLIEAIISARLDEAKTLGRDINQVSTFTNKIETEVVSIYNKSWLWLSSTWEAPKSIYWGDKEWTRGIKVDRHSYEAFLYGAQLLKQLTVSLSNATLKEIFSPHTNVEAKKKMKSSSFEKIFGVPLILPLHDGEVKQLFKKYRRILKKEEHSREALHMKLLAALDGIIVPESTDDYRLMLLYYSGDLSRGDVHIRAVIDDVIPSVASKVQQILKRLNRSELFSIRELFGLDRDENKEDVRLSSLPAMLANAYGPGYVWSSMQSVFHRQPIRMERICQVVARKLTELANKQQIFSMRQELVFYYSFMYFLDVYYQIVLNDQREGITLQDFLVLATKYHEGTITANDLTSPESLGFVSGLALRQFSRSYGAKTKKDFINHRVMKFGSKLNPEMIWKNGLIRCEELARQWDLGIKENFRTTLAYVLIGFLRAKEEGWLANKKEHMMTAFWSGYLMYDQVAKE